MAQSSTPQQSDTTPAATNIYTIPMEFYGGKNSAPVETPIDAAPASGPNAPGTISVAPTAVPVEAKLPATQLAKTGSSKNSAGAATGPTASGKGLTAPAARPAWFLPMIIIGAVLVIGSGAFGAWWFLLRSPVPPPEASIPQPPIIATAQPPAETALVPSSDQPVAPVPAETAVTPPSASVVDVIIGPHTFKDSPDGDTDGLTDIEEELWGTSGGGADTDADTYPDAVELANLYSPVEASPARLIDGKLINSYVNPEYQYTMYYPASWLSTSLEESKKEVLFTSITQEYVQVTALPYPSEQTFATWFAASFPTEKLETYVPFVNRFKVSGVMSADGTVAVITDGSQVYVLTYNGGSREEINYRQTFKMMVESFKTVNVTTPIDLLPRS